MTTLEDWTRLAREIRPRTEIFIDGKFRTAASGATFDSLNPATGELITRVSSGGAEDVDAAVRSARAAFDSGVWSADVGRPSQARSAAAGRTHHRAQP